MQSGTGAHRQRQAEGGAKVGWSPMTQDIRFERTDFAREKMVELEPSSSPKAAANPILSTQTPDLEEAGRMFAARRWLR